MRRASSPEYQSIIYLILFATLLLLIPAASRAIRGYPVMYGSESYYHARISLQLLHGFPGLDAYVYGDRPFTATPYHVILAVASVIIGMDLAVILLPILLGLISLILLHIILSNHGFPKSERFYALLMLMLSPAFIYTFTTAAPTALLAVLYLAAFILFEQGKPWSALLGIAALAGTLLFGPQTAVITVFVLLLIIIRYSRYLAILLTACLVAVIHLYLHPSIPPIATILSNLLSDFGSLNGFGTFALLLVIIAAVRFWHQRVSLEGLYLGLILALAGFFLFGSWGNAYAMFFFAVLSGMGLYSMMRSRWRVALIRNLTLLIVFCGITFSTVSFLARVSAMEPTPEAAASLLWLKEQPAGLVLSHPSKGFWIEFLASMPVLADDQSLEYYAENNPVNDSQTIFYSRNLIRTTQLLELYNIRYIWIDKHMLSGQVWNKPSEGLLFLFRSNETFRLVYTNPEAQIWEYISG